MLLIGAFLMGWTTMANAQGREAPLGWWTVKQGEVTTCLEILPDHKLKLTFQGKLDRHPIVVDGDYVLTANKLADFHVTFTAKKIWQKQLSRCRESWHDEDLHETKQLGRTIKEGDALKLTMQFGCTNEHPSVQLCSHDDKVTCVKLEDPNRTCKPPSGPAIDGSKINPPLRR